MRALVRYGLNKLEPEVFRKVLYHSTNDELLESECERLNKTYPEFTFEVEDEE